MAPFLAVLALAGLVLAGCAEPALPEPDEPVEPAVPDEPVPDEGAAGLADEVARLASGVEAARAHLEDAAAAQDVAAARYAGALALSQLAGVDGPGAAGAPPPVLPAATIDRDEPGTQQDLLSATLTAAREVGAAGQRVLAVLRDPIAGDLGAWERDAAGMVGLARDAAGAAEDVAGLEAAVLGLDGDLPRALAWAFVAAGAEDLALVHAAAERGAVHLDVVLLVLDRELGRDVL